MSKTYIQGNLIGGELKATKIYAVDIDKFCRITSIQELIVRRARARPPHRAAASLRGVAADNESLTGWNGMFRWCLHATCQDAHTHHCEELNDETCE